MDQCNVLIVSDDGEFSRRLAECWQGERRMPAFTLVGSDLDARPERSAFDLAIIGSLRRQSLRTTLKAVDAQADAVIVVVEDREALSAINREFPRLLALIQREGWADSLVQLGAEVLRRLDAVNRAERAERLSAALHCNATLGQYVIEMRHTLNNALTSVLGNAELLLLEPGSFSAGIRSQIDTIRNMALRMHEILQRFSSLEKELTFASQQASKEQKAAAAAVGQ